MVILSIPVTPVPPIIKAFAVTNSTLTMQLYSPDWVLPNGLTVAVLVYLVVFSITELLTGVIITPAGPDIWAVTFTGTSTNGLKSTVQIRVTVDPTGRMGLAGVLDNVIITATFGTGGEKTIMHPFFVQADVIKGWCTLNSKFHHDWIHQWLIKSLRGQSAITAVVSIMWGSQWVNGQLWNGSSTGSCSRHSNSVSIDDSHSPVAPHYSWRIDQTIHCLGYITDQAVDHPNCGCAWTTTDGGSDGIRWNWEEGDQTNI